MKDYESLVNQINSTIESGFDKSPPKGISSRLLTSLSDADLLQLYCYLREHPEEQPAATALDALCPDFIEFVTHQIQGGCADPALQPICRELVRVAQCPSVEFTLDREALLALKDQLTLLMEEFESQTASDLGPLRAAFAHARRQPAGPTAKPAAPGWLAQWSPAPERGGVKLRTAGVSAKDSPANVAKANVPLQFEQGGAVFRVETRHTAGRWRIVLSSSDSAKLTSVATISFDDKVARVERIADETIIRIDRIVFEDYKRRYLNDSGNVAPPVLTIHRLADPAASTAASQGGDLNGVCDDR